MWGVLCSDEKLPWFNDSVESESGYMCKEKLKKEMTQKLREIHLESHGGLH